MRHTIEIQIRIEEIAPIRPTHLELKLSPVSLIQKPLLPPRLCIWHTLLLPQIYTVTQPTLLDDDPDLLIHLGFAIILIIFVRPLPLVTNNQSIQAPAHRPVKVRFVCIYISIQPGIHNPLHDPKRSREPRRQSVADGVVEVITEDEVVAIDCSCLRRESERDTVLVLCGGVRGEVEVGRGGGGGAREATVVL